jgi:hypothetical protein
MYCTVTVYYTYTLYCAQCFGSGFVDSGSGSGTGSMVLMTKKSETNYNRKKCKFFFIKNCNLLIPRTTVSIKDVQATKEAFSLKRERPALQNMRYLNFFLLLWVFFALLDPDSLT